MIVGHVRCERHDSWKLNLDVEYICDHLSQWSSTSLLSTDYCPCAWASKTVLSTKPLCVHGRHVPIPPFYCWHPEHLHTMALNCRGPSRSLISGRMTRKVYPSNNKKSRVLRHTHVGTGSVILCVRGSVERRRMRLGASVVRPSPVAAACQPNSFTRAWLMSVLRQSFGRICGKTLIVSNWWMVTSLESLVLRWFWYFTLLVCSTKRLMSNIRIPKTD